MTTSSGPGSSPPWPSPVDFATLALLTGGRESGQRTLLADYVTVAPDDLRQLREAVRGHDAAQIARCTHRILGASTVIAATAVSAASRRLEKAAKTGNWPEIHVSARALDRAIEQLLGFIEAHLARNPSCPD